MRIKVDLGGDCRDEGGPGLLCIRRRRRGIEVPCTVSPKV